MTEAEAKTILQRLLLQTRKRSLKTSKQYEIDLPVLIKMYQKQEGRCAVTGVTMRKPIKPRDPFQPSIDRINSQKGYTPKNIRIVCLIVNMAMFTWGQDDFDRMVKARYALLVERQKAVDLEKLTLDDTVLEEDKLYAEGTVPAYCDLPNNWFYVRRKLGLPLPEPTEIHEYTNTAPRRYYNLHRVVAWLNVHPQSRKFSPKKALKLLYHNPELAAANKPEAFYYE